MIFEFATEFLHDADGRHGGSVTERAERAAKHVLRKFFDQIDVLAATQSSVKAFQHFAQPGGAFATGNTPATGFMCVKMHNAARHVHHEGVLVHHHHAAGAHHAACFSNGVVVHREIDFVGGHQRAGTAAGNDGL